MGGAFFIFLAVPIFELWLLARFALRFGVLPVVALTVGAAALGVTIASIQGRRAVKAFSDELAAGRTPHESVIGSVLVLCAGLLFIVPGVVTDLLGALLLVPFLRNAVARSVAQRVGLTTQVVTARRGRRGVPPTQVGRVYVREGDVIDTTGEEIDDER